MAETKVICLDITTFRRFKDIRIPLGSNVTLIAGQNGTSKSTLLGMLAQPFSFGVLHGKTAGSEDQSSYTDNYHGLVLSKYIDLAGRCFMYDCDNVFRLSKAYDNINKSYQYETVLENIILAPNSPLVNNNRLFTRNRERPTLKSVRFVTGPGASHKSGEGNFPHPVIYLGLNRLWPLAEVKKCVFTTDTLSKADKDWYIQKYNEILCLDEYTMTAKFMDAREKKKFVTPEGTDYDGESCSAGQDNLGQLLTAILSFKHLKTKLGDKYRGGMLLIDELDATLHAYAQERLLRLLCEESLALGLQVIATTHSLWMLKMALKSQLRQYTKVIYLSNTSGRLTHDEFTKFEDIAAHLRVEAPSLPAKKPKKVSVIFEDKEGQFLFQQICGSKLRSYVAVGNATSFGAGDLKNLGMLATKLPTLQDVILITDGDMANTWSIAPKNLLILPGKARPETLAYRHLFSMPANDPFWGKPITYTKQVAITAPGGTTFTTGDDKAWVKDWYKKQSTHWGKGNERLFKSWVESHKEECLDFCNRFLKLLKARYTGEIPKDIIKKVLGSFKNNESKK
jgi:hypothetical protein